MKHRIVLLFFAVLFSGTVSTAQVTEAEISQFLNSDALLQAAGINQAKEVKEYYKTLNYAPCWMGANSKDNRDLLIELLGSAPRQGLKEEDYQYDFIQDFLVNPGFLKQLDDSVAAEIRFSDAAIHFFRELVYGNVKPPLGYDGLGYVPDCYNIPLLLAQNYTRNQLYLLSEWEPPMMEIRLIHKKILLLEDLQTIASYTEEKITSSAVTHLNKPLLKKLFYLGISDSMDLTSDKEIKEKLKEAQRQFNLLADGILRATILQELNVPVWQRLEQLKLSLNYYRWLHCLIREEPTIVVNIPATYLKVYDQTGVKLEMRMVIGKPSTPTPSLSSRVNEVILYPYWMVPHSIATKELLPSIKRNAGYIDANNFQVLSRQGKIMDPYKINWQELSISNFPYIIRQSTGCDNALGLLKINFYNPYSVYLHDTPLKNLFQYNKRYFSHGCMRLQKPIELGHLVLKNNAIAIDTLEEKGCLRNQSPIVVPADVKMPVIVWYNPAGIDSSGRVILYEDVYKKLRWKKTKK